MNINFEGYQKKNIEEVGYFKCPNCNILSQSGLTGRDEGIYECDNCKYQGGIENFPIIPIKKAMLTCRKCQTKISATPINCAIGRFYICFKCRNVVAVKYNRKLFQPHEVMNSNFQSPDNLKQIGEKISLVECCNLRTTLPLTMLQFLSKEERNGFLSFQSNHQKAILIYVQDKCIGYLIWSFKKHEHEGCPILRQIFIKKEYRLQNLGTFLIKKWHEVYVSPHGKKFGVEDPNHITFKILNNLKHITKDNNCFIIS